MNHKLYIRVYVYILLVSILVACGPKSTPAPLTNTLPPATNTVPPPTETSVPPTITPPPPTDTPAPPTDTPLPPTDTPTPTQAGFVNQLIYDIPEMYSVTVQAAEFPELSALQLPGTQPDNLPMNIFYPPNWQGELLPAVILPNTWDLDREAAWPMPGIGLISNYESWGREFAANGLIAIAYETTNPSDLDALVKYIQENGSEYGIDASNLGLFAVSQNTVLMGSYVYQEEREFIKYAVFFYGNAVLLDSPLYNWYVGCRWGGCYFEELPDVTQLRRDLPIFVVRVGQDIQENLLSIDYFIQQAEQQGVPMTLVRFDEGSHPFDFKSYSSGDVATKGIEIIQQAIDFMKAHAFTP